MLQDMEPKTPWQKVFHKFGLSQRALGRKLGRDGAKINRAIKDDEGLINGNDQKKILEVAQACGVDIQSDDLVPQVNE